MTIPSNRTVSVVVVTAGLHSFLPQCLLSLSEQTCPPCEVLLIDNSEDGVTVSQAASAFARVKVCRSGENLFFARGLNEGIRLSRGAFILCLNDDVVLDTRFIEEAMRGFAVEGRVGMVAGKLLRFDRETLDSTGLFLSPWRSARERGYGRRDRGQFEREGYVFGASGAAAFFRRSMLEEVKQGKAYFDEEFEMFYEDLDIAWRANRRGWKGYYVSKAWAYHLRGASVRGSAHAGKSRARTYLSGPLHAALVRNRYLTVIKNETATGFIVRLPLFFLYDCAQWLYLLLCRGSHLRCFTGIPGRCLRAFRKRCEVNRTG